MTKTPPSRQTALPAPAFSRCRMLIGQAFPRLVRFSQRRGFTMTELQIAMVVFGVLMAATITGLIHILRSEAHLMLQSQLNADALSVISLLRETTRLSSISEMRFYPSNGPPMAISYPVPARATGDAVLGPSGRIAWQETLVLHAWPHDNPTELRLTSFRDRNPLITDVERDADLARVVLDGHGANATGDSNATTRVLTSFAPRFQIITDGRLFDFYNASDVRESDVVMGGVRLLPGPNSIRFHLSDQNRQSDGYGLRLDQLRISPAGIPIEAEALLPVVHASGAVVAIVEDVASGWSDRRWLSFPADATDAELEIEFYNDTWHETIFLAPGSDFSNAVTYMHTEAGNVGSRLRPKGREIAWAAEHQAATSGWGATNNILPGAAIRVIARGGRAVDGSHVLTAGDGCTVVFRATDNDFALGGMYVTDAFISEVADHDNPGADIDDQTTVRLQFGTPGQPRNWQWIQRNQSVRTIPSAFLIAPEKSYAISYRIYGAWLGWQFGMPWIWPCASTTNRFDSFFIPGSSAPTVATTRAAQWSSRNDIVGVPGIIGIAEIETTYANTAVYTSRVIDTRLTQTEFQTFEWLGDIPVNTSMQIKVRTANQADLSDAPSWDLVSPIPQFSPCLIPVSSGNGRYIQVRIRMTRDPLHDRIPELEYFTIRWLGAPAFVEFGGVFGRYPSGGIARVFVNDEPPVASLRTILTLSGSSPVEAVVSWALGLETSPRN